MKPARTIIFVLTFVCLLMMSACSQPDPQAERQRVIAETFAKWKSCVSDAEAEGDVKLAVTAVMRRPDEVTVRLVAYALDKPVEFDAPVYSLSRGRWLIDEKARAYLLDEQCREYKLKGRKSGSEVPVPLDGRIKLASGQAFELALSFSPVPEEVKMGVLVYGKRVLPFSIAQP